MTKNRSRKSSKGTVTETAMDPSAKEQTTPEAPRVSTRDAYAVQTLVAEVTALFPETTYETSHTNAFNTRLVVAFDDGETPDLYPLLELIETDPRVRGVDRDSIENYSVVEFHDSLRTQDSRDPFGLAEAHAILTAESDAAWAENDARLDEAVVENDAEPDA